MDSSDVALGSVLIGVVVAVISGGISLLAALVWQGVNHIPTIDVTWIIPVMIVVGVVTSFVAARLMSRPN